MVNKNDHLYHWSRLYRALCLKGPDLLVGIDEELREIIKMSSESSDMFWSDGLEELLFIGASDGDLRAGVLSALDLWRENVLEALDMNFGIEMSWDLVSIDDESSLIDELVEAASPE